jgi:hypothetical protein
VILAIELAEECLGTVGVGVEVEGHRLAR